MFGATTEEYWFPVAARGGFGSPTSLWLPSYCAHGVSLSQRRHER